MKTKTLLMFLITFLVTGISGGQPKVDSILAFPLQDDLAYQVGEKISYRIHYGIINAGKASIEVKEKTKVNGKEVFHMVGTGRTVGMAEWFFKTRDVYETYIDVNTFEPVKFIRDVDEGGYIIKRNIVFDREANTAIDKELKKDTVFSLPENVQDIFSAFYFARNLNVEGIKKGDVIDIPVFLDHELFPFKIKFVGRETIKTKFGKIKCLRFVPVVQEGRVFKDEDDMYLWISDDPNHVPVRIKSELLVGSIKIDLDSYSGLRHKLPVN